MPRLLLLAVSAAIATMSGAATVLADGETSPRRAARERSSPAVISPSVRQNVVLTRERGVRVWRPLVSAPAPGGQADGYHPVEEVAAAGAASVYAGGYGLAYPSTFTPGIGQFGYQKQSNGYVTRVRGGKREFGHGRHGGGHQGHQVKTWRQPGQHHVVNVHFPRMPVQRNVNIHGRFGGFNNAGSLGAAPRPRPSFDGYSGLGARAAPVAAPRSFGAGHGAVRIGGRKFGRMGRH